MAAGQKFDHREIEKKWQKKWEKEGIYTPKYKKSGKKPRTDLSSRRKLTGSRSRGAIVRDKPFFNLWMFPYPSAEGLHAGHAFSSTGDDVYGRFMRMSGKNTFQPFVGFDSFGIHSENYALKVGTHPIKLIASTTKHYTKQFKSLGHGYDYTRTVTTSDPKFYKWTQWLFTQMFKAGLAYRKRSKVNWCLSCKTVLADEQVMTPAQAGKEPKDAKGNPVKDEEGLQVCERCGTIVEKRNLKQWMFRITDYADRLLENQKKIDWPEKVKLGQKNWIGRSEGVNFKHKVKDLDIEFEVYDSIPQTHRAQTFVVIAPEHPIVNDLVRGTKYEKDVLKFIEKIKKKKSSKKFDVEKEMEGVFTGRYSENYLGTGVDLPIWVASFVIMDYGTGIVGCSAHDERDFKFAKKYGLPLKPVLFPKDKKLAKKVRDLEVFYREPDGILEEPKEFKGKRWDESRESIIDYVVSRGFGRRVTNYHLRDWLLSRQRYWGTPIPMIYCQECAKAGRSWFTENFKTSKLQNSQQDKIGKLKNSKLIENWKLSREAGSRLAGEIGNSLLHQEQGDWDHAGWYPVSESDLPVELPDIADYKPKGTGRGPLDNHPEFYKVKCPGCGSVAKRETDVADTFLDSSWYFLRYPTVGLDNEDKVPFDPEITNRWLPVDLYFGGAEHTVLHLMYARFVTMVLNDLGYLKFDEPFPHFYAHGLMIKDGAKMSKSRGNVINPDEYIEKYGADTLRLYMMFMGPMDGFPDFRDTGIEGMRRFTEKVWRLFQNPQPATRNPQLTTRMHQTIKKVTEDISEFKYNTAIAAIMEYVNLLKEQIDKDQGSRIKDQDNDSKPKTKTIHHSPFTIHLKALALMLAPFAPHMIEEVWQRLRAQGSRIKDKGSEFKSIHLTNWPKYDPKLVKEECVTVAVQVNGKLRSTISVQSAKCKEQNEVIKLAKEDERVQKWLSGKKMRKEIFVPGKLVNFVVT